MISATGQISLFDARKLTTSETVAELEKLLTWREKEKPAPEEYMRKVAVLMRKSD